MSEKCAYCGGVAIGHTTPGMCEKHWQVAMAMSWVMRSGRKATVYMVKDYLIHLGWMGKYQDGEVERMMGDLGETDVSGQSRWGGPEK